MIESLLMPLLFCLFVVSDYPIFRDQLKRSLSGVDTDTAEAILHSLRLPIRRLYWGWICASAACVGIVTWQTWSSENSSSVWLFAILAICVILWTSRSSVLKRLEKELEDRDIPQTARPLESARLATLRPRTVTSYLPTVMLVLPWVFVVLFAAYLAVNGFQNPPTELWMWLWAIGGILGACLMIFIGMQLISAIVSESLPAGDSTSRITAVP